MIHAFIWRMPCNILLIKPLGLCSETNLLDSPHCKHHQLQQEFCQRAELLQAADQEAEIRNLRCQIATLADDSETAHIRAVKAEERMYQMEQETRQLRDSAAQALTEKQVHFQLIWQRANFPAEANSDKQVTVCFMPQDQSQ